MRSDTGTVWECGTSAPCEFHAGGGSPALPCCGVDETRSFTPARSLSMPEAVHAFEKTLIESALKRALISLPEGTSHATKAAEMLGLTRQGLLLILKGRHKSLAHLVVRSKGGSKRKESQ